MGDHGVCNTEAAHFHTAETSRGKSSGNFAHALTIVQFFRSGFGIQRFIDILRNYYCYASEDPFEGLKSPESRPTTKRRLNDDELRVIQWNILHSIGLMLNESVEFEEVQAIVHFLQECTDSIQLIGILRLLFDLLSKPVKNLLHHLENLGGIRPLLCLLYKKDENIRIMDYKVIGTTNLIQLTLTSSLRKITATISPKVQAKVVGRLWMFVRE